MDLSNLRAIRYADGLATIGPAAQLGDVYTRLAAKGVTIPAGSCPTVALGGLVLGGGMGLAGRAMGLTLDRVRSFDVVDRRRRAPQGSTTARCSGRCAAGEGASASSPPCGCAPATSAPPPTSRSG